MKKVIGGILVGLPCIGAFVAVGLVAGWLFAVTSFGAALILAAMIISGIFLLTNEW